MKKRIFTWCILPAITIVLLLPGCGQTDPGIDVPRPDLDPSLEVREWESSHERPYATGCATHVLIIDSYGTIWGYGFNTYGQLALGYYRIQDMVVKPLDGGEQISMRAQSYDPPVEGPSGVAHAVVQRDRSLLLMEDGTVQLWGNWAKGTGVGMGLAQDDQGNWYQVGEQKVPDEPLHFPLMNKARDIALSYQNAYVLGEDNVLWVFRFPQALEGMDAWKYGEPFTPGTWEPNIQRWMDNVIWMSHSFAITQDGDLWGWGSNTQGRLGNGKTEGVEDKPVKILENVLSVSAGNNHVLAVTTDGALYGWGSNTQGQLRKEASDEPVLFPVFLMENVDKAWAIGQSSYMVFSDGSLWAFGGNTLGELGNGTRQSTHDPVKVMDQVITDVQGLYNGTRYALDRDGNLFSWGAATYTGTGRDESIPALVLRDVQSFSVGDGYNNVTAVLQDRTIWHWGRVVGQGASILEKPLPRQLFPLEDNADP